MANSSGDSNSNILEPPLRDVLYTRFVNQPGVLHAFPLSEFIDGKFDGLDEESGLLSFVSEKETIKYSAEQLFELLTKYLKEWGLLDQYAIWAAGQAPDENLEKFIKGTT